MILRKSLGIDKADMKLHIDNIMRSLNAVQHITGNLSKMENLCSNTKIQIEELRKNISGELDQMLTKSFDKNEESKEECSQEDAREDTEKENKEDKKTKSRRRGR